MNFLSAGRRIILIGTIVLLLVIAWAALWGGISQLPRCQTLGQKAETAIQIANGLLSALVVITCFYWPGLRRAVRAAWTILWLLRVGGAE